MKVVTVLGTRPEAIKLGPVIRELERHATVRDLGGDAGSVNAQASDAPPVTVRVCVTGQHRHMLDQVLRLFNIDPDYDLDVMEENQSPTQVAAAVLAGLESVLRMERPDWVLVQGDTSTVAAASLAAFYSRVRVGHVEAGLRSHDKWQPFPEEVNRRIAGVIADLHFAPTERARQNLRREGIGEDRIAVTGNTVVDALQWIASQPFDLAALSLGPSALKDSGTKVILVTAHRRENFGSPLENVCLALRDIAERYDGQVCIVYPVHMNPNVWEPVHRLLGGISNILLTPPMDYLPWVHLMKQSYLVLTDSGGIQEEAPGLGVPVLVLREVTERPEAVELGTARVVGTDRQRIVTEAVRLLEDADAHAQMARSINPYGDGQAAARIVRALLDA